MCAPFRKTSQELWGREAAAAPQAAVDEMRYLITTGMRAHYSQEMAKLEAVYSGCGEEELIEAAKAVNPSANEDSYLPKMLSAWRRYGENALLGWDVGRCCLVSQWCYLCGYLSMEEILDTLAPQKKTRQK